MRLIRTISVISAIFLLFFFGIGKFGEERYIELDGIEMGFSVKHCRAVYPILCLIIKEFFEKGMKQRILHDLLECDVVNFF